MDLTCKEPFQSLYAASFYLYSLLHYNRAFIFLFVEDVDALVRKWKRALCQGRCRVSVVGSVVVCASLCEVCRAWPHWCVTEQLLLRSGSIEAEVRWDLSEGCALQRDSDWILHGAERCLYKGVKPELG